MSYDILGSVALELQQKEGKPKDPPPSRRTRSRDHPSTSSMTSQGSATPPNHLELPKGMSLQQHMHKRPSIAPVPDVLEGSQVELHLDSESEETEMDDLEGEEAELVFVNCINTQEL